MVSTVAQVTAPRGALVLYVASDFVPSSTQHVVDPRYFLKSCNIPILEPRTHQEMLEAPGEAADLGRRYGTPVAVLANGLLCHSDGLVRLGPCRVVPRVDGGPDYRRFMNLPDIAHRNHETICAERLPGLRAHAERTPHNRIEWHDRALGVVVHGLTEAFVREVWRELPVKPSILSLGLTYPLPRELTRQFVAGIDGPVVVLADGQRFVQEELLAQGLAVTGKPEFDSCTEWSPDTVARRLGAAPASHKERRATAAVPAAISDRPRSAQVARIAPSASWSSDCARRRRSSPRSATSAATPSCTSSRPSTPARAWARPTRSARGWCSSSLALQAG